jgi:hypothetical protein
MFPFHRGKGVLDQGCGPTISGEVVANLSCDEQEVGTFGRRERNDVQETAVLSADHGI